MWNKFWLWLWGEPPLTFWAVWMYLRIDRKDPCNKLKICTWRAVPILGWKLSIEYQHDECNPEAIVGPFPELTDAQKFCDDMNRAGIPVRSAAATV